MTSLISGAIIGSIIEAIGAGLIYSNKLPEGVSGLIVLIAPLLATIIILIGIFIEIINNNWELPAFYSWKLILPLVLSVSFGFFTINLILLYAYVH